jgi:transposase
LRTRPKPGKAPWKSRAALAVIEELLAVPLAPRPSWTLPRLQRAVRERTGISISAARLSVVLRERGILAGGDHGTRCRAGRMPRRCGLRLKLLAPQAAAGDIMLLLADASERLTHPCLAYVWARRGEDLRVAAPGQAQRRARLGALDAARRELVVVTRARKRSGDLLLLLERLYGPAPDWPSCPVVLVLDNGPIHTSQATTRARAARPWLTLEWLPKHAPELNAIEHRWRDLKAHFLAHQTVASADQRDAAIHRAVQDLNRERQAQTCSDLCKAA